MTLFLSFCSNAHGGILARLCPRKQGRITWFWVVVMTAHIIICVECMQKVSGPVALHHWVLPSWFILSQYGDWCHNRTFFFFSPRSFPINICVECNLAYVEEQRICTRFCFKCQKLAFETYKYSEILLRWRCQVERKLPIGVHLFGSGQIQLRILNVVVTSFQVGLVKILEKCIKSSLWWDSIHPMMCWGIRGRALGESAQVSGAVWSGFFHHDSRPVHTPLTVH